MSGKPNWDSEIQHKISDLTNLLKKREKEIRKMREQLDKDRAAFEEEMRIKRTEQEKNISDQLNEVLKEKCLLEDEKKRMEGVFQFQSCPVSLNVGGQRFFTSLQTLRRDPNSMLAVMFSGRHNLIQDADGSFFVDRDGTHFRHILNFLRDGFRADMLPQDTISLREIQNEANYYQLSGLVAEVESVLNPPPPSPDFTQHEINEMLATLMRQGGNNDPPGLFGANRSSRGADFVFHNMTKANLDFSQKNLKGLSFAHTTFAHNVSFVGACLENASFYGCEFVSHIVVDFTNANISGADFRQCRCVEGGPKPFGGLGGASAGAGGGFMFGSSCSSFVHLIRSGHLKFKGARHIGTQFDPNVQEMADF